jgi:2-methylcitrate dehydratase PrpD
VARSDPEDRHSHGELSAASASTGEGFAAFLGAHVAALRFDDLPAEALHWAKVGILDTVGVTLAGSREDAPRLLAKALDLAPGPSLVLGLPRRVGVLDAAYLNGTASHALDFDDCSNTLGGHPSAPVLSALFPLADDLGASGRDFVLAYVAGFEVETKIALAVNFHHYTKGWHPTATLGVFGAAAAAARLMGLDAQATSVALALAASFASGLKANFGTMAKPMHVGHSARNGMLAARLANAGFTANAQSVFEHEQGFLDVFNGPGTYDVRRATAAWADPLDIIEPGIAIKQYPCCGSTHPAIDAMLDIVERRRIDPSQVERVDAWIHARRLRHTNRPRPDSALDAKFSLQYVLARALADRAVSVAHFENESYRDARIAELLRRVHVAPYDASQFGADNHFGGEVRVTLRDGTVETGRVEQALGRTSDNPVPAERLRRKFELCAATVLRENAIAPVAHAIDVIETLRDLRELTNALADGTIDQGKPN